MSGIADAWARNNPHQVFVLLKLLKLRVAVVGAVGQARAM